jgi:hypothetical protein
VGSFGIYFCLEMPKTIGSLLHLVEDDGRGMALEESVGFLLGLFRLGE